EQARFRSRIEHVEGFDLGVIAPRPELRRDEVGILLVVSRADVMRARREPLHPVAQILPLECGVKLRFERALSRCMFGAETEHRGIICGRRVGERRKETEKHDEKNRFWLHIIYYD